jgi:uncharacterized membrane protein YgcG
VREPSACVRHASWDAPMETVLNFSTRPLIILFGLSALVAFCTGIYWIFNKRARQRQLAELRATYEEMQPTDPQYNQVRALYTAMMIDAHRADFAAASNGSGSGSGGGGGGGSSVGSDSDGGGAGD